MNRRVVVTGTGVITPVGNDVNTYWKNLLEGVCGIDFIQSFPTDDLPVKIAGEVKDFNPADYACIQFLLRARSGSQQNRWTDSHIGIRRVHVYILEKRTPAD